MSMTAINKATGDRISAALRAENEKQIIGGAAVDLDGWDNLGWNVPTFTTDAQVERFLNLRLRITHQRMGRDGVQWSGVLTEVGTDLHVDVEQDGNGGCNLYFPWRAMDPIREFAAEILLQRKYEQEDILMDLLSLIEEVALEDDPNATEEQTEEVTLADLQVGDRVLRPFFNTVEVVTVIRPRTPRARTYLTVEFQSGNEWTNHKTYAMRRVLAA